jgi:hypothetical protein
MGSPRWLIGTLMAWIILGIVGNIIEGAAIITTTQVAQIQSMTEMNTSEAADPTVGGVLTYGGAPKNMVDSIISAITMDWTWLYEVDKATSQAACTAGALQGWRWNSTVSGCQKPNEYYWIWAIIWYPIMIALLFELAILLARLIRGV